MAYLENEIYGLYLSVASTLCASTMGICAKLAGIMSRLLVLLHFGLLLKVARIVLHALYVLLGAQQPYSADRLVILLQGAEGCRYLSLS